MKDLFLLLDSAILKGKGPPPPPTSRNFPSTLKEAYMIENKSKKPAERRSKPTKDQGERNQKTAATANPQNSHCRWERRRQQKKPLTLHRRTQDHHKEKQPFLWQKTSSGETPAAGKVAGDQKSQHQLYQQ